MARLIERSPHALARAPQPISSLHVERTLSGEMKVEEFNRQFFAQISCPPDETLSDLISKELDHSPVKGEEVRIDLFVFTILEPSLRGVKVLSVHTVTE